MVAQLDGRWTVHIASAFARMSGTGFGIDCSIAGPVNPTVHERHEFGPCESGTLSAAQ